MVPYPSEFPTGALTMILDKLRGQPVLVADLVHGAWNVAGYALAQSLPVQQPIGTQEFKDDIELIEYAIAEGVPPVAEDGVVRGVIPWLLILKLVLKIIAENAA